MDMITYQDFAKLDIRIGRVVAAKPVDGTDRLIELSVDIGEETPRTLVAGMRAYYEPEAMIGKHIVVLANLEPRKMRGIISNGMILAASAPNFETVKLLTVDGEVPPGSKIS